MKIDTDFKVGKPSPKTWSSVLGYRPETDALIEIFGEMFAVISLRSEIEFDLANVGDLLFDELQQSYFGEHKRIIELGDFENALRKVKTRIDTILEREDQLSQTGVDLEMAVAVVRGQTLYLGVVGESKVFVRRGENFAEVGNALIDGEMGGFMRTGSMYLTAGDSVMLMTSELAASVSSDKARGVMDKFKLSEVPVIHGAALLVGYERPEPVPASEPELLPAETDFLDEDTESAHDLEPAVARISTEEVEDDEHESISQEIMEDEERKPRAEFVKPLGPVLDDEEDAEDDNDIRPTMAMRGEALKASGAVGAVAAGGTLMDKLKPQLVKTKGQLTTLFGKAKTKAADLKDKAIAMKNERAARVQMLEDDEMDDEDELQESDSEQSYVPARREGQTDRFNRLSSRSANTIQTVIAKIISWFKVHILGQADRQQMYLRGGHGQRNWRVLAIIGVVIAVILFLGIRKVAQDRDYQGQILAAQGKISTLSQRYDDLNMKVTTLSIGTADEAQRTSVMNDLSTLISEANTLKQEKIFTTETKMKDDVDSLISRAQASQDQAANVVAFTQPQVVADLGVNFQDVDLAHMTYSNGKVYVSDRGRGVIYRMGTAIGSETTAFVNGLSNPTLLKVMPNGNLLVVDNNTDSCVAVVDITAGTLKRQAGLSKAKIGDLSAVDVWTNEAMYSVNPQKQALLKQESVAGNFQLPNDSNPWRTDSDFASAIDMAVDFWIYVLVRGKGMTRYLGGQPDDFNFVGLMSADKNALNQATAFDITATHLYIADPLNKRVLMFEKSTTDNKIITFKQQFVYRGEGVTFTKIKDIVANEETKKLYVLDGTQVIRLDL